jgi:hypothetical protein
LISGKTGRNKNEGQGDKNKSKKFVIHKARFSLSKAGMVVSLSKGICGPALQKNVSSLFL